MSEDILKEKNFAHHKANDLEAQAQKCFEDAGDLEIKYILEQLKQNKIRRLDVNIISAFSCYEKAKVRKGYLREVVKELDRIQKILDSVGE